MSAGSLSGDSTDVITELCGSAYADLRTLVPQIVGRIRQEIPGYGVVDRVEQERVVTQQFSALLTGLMTRRPPSPEDSEHARALGRQRALLGLPLESLIGAYHVGYRELWNHLLIRADSQDHEARSQLAGLVSIVWNWVEYCTSAAADAYGKTIRAEFSVQLGLTHQFLDALAAGGPVTAGQAHLALALGFDPDGTFQAICSNGDALPNEDTTVLRDRLRRHRGTVCCLVRGTVLIALVQNIEAEAVVGALHELNSRAPIGIGLARSGLLGASTSIVDAQEVLPAADGRVGSFEQDWLLATIRPQAARLDALLGTCGRTAASHPQLADTVRSFVEHGLSLNATGGALHVHANTVKYRLERWRELTGWDVRTWAGLSASMVGIGLSPV